MTPFAHRRVRFAAPLAAFLAALFAAIAVPSAHADAPPTGAQLEQDAAALMAEHRVPGVAVAYDSGGGADAVFQLGDANAISGSDVTPETLFAAASLGKVVTAYGAMLLVDEGKLALDRPLSSYLKEPWLPTEPAGNPVTLRQVLSHSSGLPNDITGGNRALTSPPGSAFAYSGTGYVYLQHVIETVTGMPFQDFARDRIFGPLAMNRSGFAVSHDWRGDLSAGHLPFLPVSIGVVVAVLVVFLLLWLVGAVVQRVRGRGWGVPASTLRVMAGLSLAAVAILAAVVAGSDILPSLALAAGVPLVVIGLVFAVAPRFAPLSSRAVLRTVQLTAAALVLCGAFWFAVRAVLLPVPLLKGNDVNAAFTLRTTAGDLARFADALAIGKGLSRESRAAMLAPQIRVDENHQWALGPSILQTRTGPVYWQWGSNPGFESLIAVQPATGRKLTVLTNAGGGNDVARELAARVFSEPASAFKINN
ncbi:serine hydrolase domain-containing protein [Sphingosinicella microcystinivorans]|uniref:serine hydrolase domain-containing protein n=1 Tax=Sphingosinicella microcystinivorans TaxID=335406 RepID=UPI00135C226E|nr:serine hydrolase domain-containing protein [Sphingosinicella microcystinivorans]